MGGQDASWQANFHRSITGVEVLGRRERPAWSRNEEELHIRTDMRSEKLIVFKILVK